MLCREEDPRWGDRLDESVGQHRQHPSVGLILTSVRMTQHNEQMINAWRRMKLSKRLYWVMLTVVGLGFIGRIFWKYDTWPFNLVLLAAIILNGAGNMRGRTTRHPQENDPNRR